MNVQIFSHKLPRYIESPDNANDATRHFRRNMILAIAI